MINMLSSATRVALLLMIISLVGMNVFALVNYPETAFNTTFLVFKDITLMIASYFFAKSTSESVLYSEKVEKVMEKNPSTIDINNL